MANVERQQKTAIEEALDFSRKLPQLGIDPEVILELGKRVSSKIQSEPPATAWEQSRAKAMQGTKERFKWGFFSRLR